ncbi:phospho-sugar mutase [Pontibacillus marinus]|uniref:phospho-sugar mutase n=1 Tax=Pontibacillus marinus TaxID=273164 RepID=UPI000482714C
MLQENLLRWENDEYIDKDLKDILETMKSQPETLEDAFYKHLEFGTGGMRGELAPGTNRMNIYTVRRAAEGLALYIEDTYGEEKQKGIAVAYDSRHKSPEFAMETAKVMGAHGIPTFLFDALRPTPELSFAIRYLKAVGGVVITASHNPPEYNGFKVYNEDGGQIPPHQAKQIIEKVNKIENELTIPVIEKSRLEELELLQWIGGEVDQVYLEQLKGITQERATLANRQLSIVFTPLHGTAYDLVVKGLKQSGFEQIHIVEEQANPDPNFSTVESPNPEEHQAFTKAIELGSNVGADILIGTDPDADRLGVAAKDSEGDYKVLTGNQLGVLMLDYLLSHNQDIPENAMMIKTIVTSEMGRAVANYYGVNTLDTLTGFKFIGEKIREFEQLGEHQFVFGYEESYGYLIGDFARDKDAIQSSVFASEMAAYYKEKGLTLFEALEILYQTHGYYLEDLESMKLKGIEGAKKITEIMDSFREEPLRQAASLDVLAIEDYSARIRTHMKEGTTEAIDLPSSNVIKFILSDDCWVCLRPSGTEPKIKFYFGMRSSNKQTSEQRLEALKQDVMARVTQLTFETV